MMPGSETLELRDIHLPADVSWWPPAPGWWIVLSISLLSVFAGVFIYRYRKRRALHKASLLELEHIRDSYNQNQDDQKLIRELSIWLRRVCLSFYPRTDVAALTGKDWLEFLEQSSPELAEQLSFSQGQGKLLITAPYQKSASISESLDSGALLALCKNWVSALPFPSKTTS